MARRCRAPPARAFDRRYPAGHVEAGARDAVLRPFLLTLLWFQRMLTVRPFRQRRSVPPGDIGQGGLHETTSTGVAGCGRLLACQRYLGFRSDPVERVETSGGGKGLQ